MAYPRITSTSNSRIKEMVRLREKNAERRRQALVLVEGIREIAFALRRNLRKEFLFVCYEIVGFEANTIIDAFRDHEIIEVNMEVFSRIAYREGSDGLLAVFHEPEMSLQQLIPGQPAFVLILDQIEKPGNLGAMLRSADAAGVDAVIVCDPVTDFYNPNVIRASLGTVFTLPLAAAEYVEVARWLEKWKIDPYAAVLSPDALHYTLPDYTKDIALVMGTESEGLGTFWITASTGKILIPMRGMADSLNVSAAAAVLMYEVVRQRMLK